MKFTKCQDGTYHDDTRRVWLKPRLTAAGTPRCHSKQRGAKDWTITIDHLAVAAVRGGARDAQARAAQLFEYYTTKGIPTDAADPTPNPVPAVQPEGHQGPGGRHGQDVPGEQGQG